ncbi:hypothetical protein [Komagataeibacter kakiaceti]
MFSMEGRRQRVIAREGIPAGQSRHVPPPTKVSNQLHAGQQAVFVNLRRGLPGGNDGGADGRLCSRPDTIAETAEFSWQQSSMPSTIQKYE